MKKKIAIGLASTATVLAILPLFAAFEAHVINVTATIENALNVPLEHIGFGTVFPQERLDKFFDVELSQSFKDEDRVDDVDYIIRQKPKCGVLNDVSPFEPKYIGFTPATENPDGSFSCPGRNTELLPLLCPYLSKHEITTDGTATGGENDSAGISAFHGLPGPWTLATTLATQVTGHLAKSEQDTLDTWNIDLKVPCFENHCAQDWERFVLSFNSSTNPAHYIQPLANEHKLFGCDLWLEVGGISLPGLGCKGKLDLMLVLDLSSSIDSTELATMKTAAKAFVDALVPSADGVHVGLATFSATSTLNVHLTSDGSAVKTTIDGLATGLSTNLASGITTADNELLNPGDGHDRLDADAPDLMVIITDGNPNTPGGEAAAEAAAAAAATTAKGNAVEIFAVGVGTTAGTTTYLKTSIVSTPDSTHYFDAVDFADLEPILIDLASCD